MKYIVAGDIHGSTYYTSFLIERILEHSPEKIILLGDIYDGAGYKEIDKMLLKTGVDIESVEGNCDNRIANKSRLNFVGSNIMVCVNGKRFLFEHGHIHNRYNVPTFMEKGDVFVYGHTHMHGISQENGIYIINSGSVGRPRGTAKNSFIFINDNVIEIRDVEFGEIIDTLEL